MEDSVKTWVVVTGVLASCSHVSAGFLHDTDGPGSPPLRCRSMRIYSSGPSHGQLQEWVDPPVSFS